MTMSDPSYHEPEESDDESSVSVQSSRHHSPPPTEQNSEERPGADPKGRLAATKRLQENLPEKSVVAYTDTLEDVDKDDIPAAILARGKRRHRTTKYGVVYWDDKEKEVLFRTLGKKGKSGIREIADAIGTKSELEVLDYLQSLHGGMERQHLRDRHSRAIVLGDVPAAVEVSKECCDALEEYAQLLRLREETSTNLKEEKKHRNFWLIDATKAEEIEKLMNLQEGGGYGYTGKPPSPSISIFLSARLFNLPKWIQLSENFFMNPGEPRLEDNWRTFAFEDETPSVTADAFADFYALVVSITRRLMQSSMFIAMSRMRNMRQSGHTKAHIVRRRDIKTALAVLRMKEDNPGFWPGLAKRCNLDVLDVRHRKGYRPRYLDHNEVEDVLSGKISFEEVEGFGNEGKDTTKPQVQLENDLSDNMTDEDYIADESEDDNDNDGTNTTTYQPNPHPPPPPANNPDDPTPSFSEDENEAEQRADLELEHANTVDNQASATEERRLWELVNQPAPASTTEPIVKTEEEEDENAKLTRKPFGARKRRRDLVDWRDVTLYRGEWEGYGHEVLGVSREIVENWRGGKRRRVEEEEEEEEDGLSSGVVRALGDDEVVVEDDDVDDDDDKAGGHSHDEDLESASNADSASSSVIQAKGEVPSAEDMDTDTNEA